MNKIIEQRVKSVIVVGDNFVEYRYDKFNQDFVGLWKKVGNKNEVNPSTSFFKCDGCQSRSDTWPARRGIHKPVSYQCVGQTKPFNQYEWNVGSCVNSESCWGGAEYLFQVKRANNFHYQFTNKRSGEVVARFNATLERKYRPTSEHHVYEGIALTSKKMKMFYPHLIDDCISPHYVYINLQPNKKLPQHLSHLYDVNMKSWPAHYQVGSYLFPNHLTFEYFLETPNMKKTPTTISCLETNHLCVGITYLEMYPGSSGLRCTQYRRMINSDFANFPSEELRRYHESRKRKNCILYEEEPRFDQASWIDNSHVFDYEAFVPNYRNGLCGPVVSFWARVNDNNSWFAAPK